MFNYNTRIEPPANRSRREVGPAWRPDAYSDEELRLTIARAVDSSPTLRSKKDLIEDFGQCRLHPAAGRAVHHEEGWRKRTEELRLTIARAVDSSPTLRSKKDLIEDFVASVTLDTRVETAWTDDIARKRAEELERLIADEQLKPAETRTFVEDACRDGGISAAGTAIVAILPPRIAR